MSLAGPARPAIAASPSDGPAADQAASPAAAPPTILRGLAPKTPEASAPQSCPDGSYYAPDLGCVVPTEPGYAGSYGSYDIPVVVIGVPGLARRHDVHDFRRVHRFARRAAVPRAAIRGMDRLRGDRFGTLFGHNGLR